MEEVVTDGRVLSTLRQTVLSPSLVVQSIKEKLWIQLASQSRFERLTCPLGGGCSIQLSYWDF